MGKQQDSSYYDGLFSEKAYSEDPEGLRWYPVWRSTVEEVIAHGSTSIIDLGCGPGLLAEVLCSVNGYPYKYVGYDFSNVAIDIADNRRLDPRFSFKLADLSTYDFHEEFDELDVMTYVSTEFLEHVEFDLDVISKMRQGSLVLFSLPRFDDPGHVRFFEKDTDIRDRYSDLLDIQAIKLMPDKWRFCIKSIKK
jgi:trans-aconitate methyltransferase